MNNSPSERLKRLREKRGYATAKEAAEAFGWHEVTYRSHENGTRNPPIDAARKYATAFGSTVGYILGIGNGAEPQIVNHIASVPLVARVSAGSFRYDEGIDGGASLVPAVPRKDISAPSQYALIVDGPSVNMRIPDGAYAICALFDSYPGGAQHGQLVHVVRERAGLHEHTIKELRYTKDGPVLMPVSTDPHHQEQINLNATEDDVIVRIQGIVIGSYQPI